MDKRLDKHLIIGAGFVGLGMARAMRRAQLPYDQVEATEALGGNWKHGVYNHVHIISSKKTTEFLDFPMPDDYPDFPSATQMHDYLKSYAAHFQLEDQIEYHTLVVSVAPQEDDTWLVTCRRPDHSTFERVYKGVLVCNGHHWSPKHPEFEGNFEGTYFHSKEYKSEASLLGKRVLVIGGGNSAVDIACDAARVADCSDISLKEGIWFLPKTIFGKPMVDQLTPFVPVWLQRLYLRILLFIINGPYTRYGLPKPTHKLFERHPTVSSTILHYLKHGRIQPRAQVKSVSGKEVTFHDGRKAEYDVMVAATGYKIDFPFLPQGMVEIKGPIPQLPEGSFHPDHKGLYLIGWAQVRYGVGPLITVGAPTICAAIKMQDRLRWPIGALLARVGKGAPKTHLIDPLQALRHYRVSRYTVKLLIIVDRFLMKDASSRKKVRYETGPTAEARYF